MNFYDVILGLYSNNPAVVLRIIKSANYIFPLVDGVEVVHTGFYCINHKGTRFDFYYDVGEQCLWFQKKLNDFHFPLGTIFNGTTIISGGFPYLSFKVKHKESNIYYYQGYNINEKKFWGETCFDPLRHSYPHFTFMDDIKVNFVEVKTPKELRFRQDKDGRFILWINC